MRWVSGVRVERFVSTSSVRNERRTILVLARDSASARSRRSAGVTEVGVALLHRHDARDGDDHEQHGQLQHEELAGEGRRTQPQA